jgi:hypothetical protein
MGSNCSNLVDSHRCENNLISAIFNSAGNGLIIVSYSWLMVQVVFKTKLTMLAIIIALMIVSLGSIIGL